MTDLACAILMRNGEILLAKRAADKRLYPNHWDLVGGHVEAGESVDAALIREVEEEVGVTPTAFRLVRGHHRAEHRKRRDDPLSHLRRDGMVGRKSKDAMHRVP